MDTAYLHSLKHRMQSRLEQVKVISEQLTQDKENTLQIIQQFGGYIGSPDEISKLKVEVTDLGMTSTEIVDDLIDELEVIEKYDWQYIATVQEKCTALILATYEEPLRLKTMHDQIYCNLMESIRGNLSAEERPVQDHEANSENYSTPSLEAMRSAVEKFWLKYDENKIPTQKAVSNYIAEQLGKPIRDRFTDELARAIKPEN